MSLDAIFQTSLDMLPGFMLIWLASLSVTVTSILLVKRLRDSVFRFSWLDYTIFLLPYVLWFSLSVIRSTHKSFANVFWEVFAYSILLIAFPLIREAVKDQRMLILVVHGMFYCLILLSWLFFPALPAN